MIDPCIQGKADPVHLDISDHIGPIAAIFTGGVPGVVESVDGKVMKLQQVSSSNNIKQTI